MPDSIIGWKGSKKVIFCLVLTSVVTSVATVTLALYWAGRLEEVFHRQMRDPVDILTFTNGGVYGVGVMVDGSITGVNLPQNDKPAVGSSLSPMLLWGDFFRSADLTKAGNEIIAFSQGLAPTLLEDVPWSSGFQNIPVTFEPAYHLLVAVRIVGPTSTFTEKYQRAGRACYDANRFWGEEGRGIIVICSEPEDKTAGSSTVSFTCVSHGDPVGSFIQSVGFTPNQINVYYVDTVESEEVSGGSGAAYGVHCPEYPDVIAMGSLTDDHLLAHEIGHALSLYDIDCLATNPPQACTSPSPGHFDTTEIMHSASNERLHLTEGEAFRAVFNQFSKINDPAYGLRGPLLTRRDCDSPDDSINNPICPAIQKRIWPDGAGFPQN